METVFVYDNTDDELQYFVLEGDYRHLDRVYINEYQDTEEDKDKQNVLFELIYDPVTGERLVYLVSDVPLQAVLNGAFVITVGFLG